MSDRFQSQNSQSSGGGTPKTNQPGVNQFNQQQQQQQQNQQQVGRGGKRGNPKPRDRRSNQTGPSQRYQHGTVYQEAPIANPAHVAQYAQSYAAFDQNQYHGYMHTGGHQYPHHYLIQQAHTAPHAGIAAPFHAGQYQNQRLPVQQQQQAAQQQPQTTGSPAPPQTQQARQPTQQQQQNATGVNGESGENTGDTGDHCHLPFALDPVKSDNAQGKQRPTFQQQQQAQQPMMMDPNQHYG